MEGLSSTHYWSIVVLYLASVSSTVKLWAWQGSLDSPNTLKDIFLKHRSILYRIYFNECKRFVQTDYIISLSRDNNGCNGIGMNSFFGLTNYFLNLICSMSVIFTLYWNECTKRLFSIKHGLPKRLTGVGMEQHEDRLAWLTDTCIFTSLPGLHMTSLSLADHSTSLLRFLENPVQLRIHIYYIYISLSPYIYNCLSLVSSVFCVMYFIC